MSLQAPARVGRQAPRISVLPPEYDPGASAVRAAEMVDLAAVAGLLLDPWQEIAAEGACRVRTDGKWAAMRVALQVNRQNGKGSVMEARQLAGLFLWNETLQVHTSHEFRTAQKHFERILTLIESTPIIDAQVSRIRRADGEEAIETKAGTKLQFMARSLKSGRGITGDTVYLDEAFALKQAMMASLLPTMAARSLTGNVQMWFASSAGMAESDVFEGVRDSALAASDPRLAWLEWSVPRDADPDDVSVWYDANPGMGIRISEDFVRAERGSLGHEEFKRERLGVWAELGGASVFPPGAWGDCLDADSDAGPVLALSLDVPPDRSSATIGLAAFRDDERTHIEIVDRRPGLDWVGPALETLAAKLKPVAIVLDGGGAAAVLIPELRERRVRTIQATARQYGQSCGAFFDLAMQGALVHIGQTELDTAVDAARRAPMGDTLWKWSRKDTLSDISPLCAATLAVHGLNQRGRTRRNKAQTGRKALLL